MQTAWDVFRFKEVKVTPVDEQGSVCQRKHRSGIYMETEGVLVVDTGEIQAEEW